MFSRALRQKLMLSCLLISSELLVSCALKNIFNTISRSVITDADVCKAAADKVETRFKDLCDLAQEMVLASTHAYGSNEQAISQNKINYEVLKKQEEGQKAVLEQNKEILNNAKASFTRLDDNLNTAVKEIPTG